MLLKNTKKTQILGLVDVTYLELENIKIRHQVYVPLCYIA